MMTILDYGLGNVQAFVSLAKGIDVELAVARSAKDLEDATKLILPGVGSFDHAMELLDRSGMRDKLDELVRVRSVPVLGVCVGMQILAERSDEGQSKGLGWIPGEVKSLRTLHEVHGERLPLPHMGWNDVRPANDWKMCEGFEKDARFYFLHSFYYSCADPADVAAVCEYGVEFPCAVRRGHVQGVQFHPEKSHHFGSGLLKNFAGV